MSHSPWRRIEFYGGPFDGHWLSYTGTVDRLEIKGVGESRHIYQMEEIVEGKKTRDILRYIEAQP